MPIYLHMSLAAFVLQQQSWEIARKTIWLAKPKIFTISFCRESLPTHDLVHIKTLCTLCFVSMSCNSISIGLPILSLFTLFYLRTLESCK